MRSPPRKGMVPSLATCWPSTAMITSPTCNCCQDDELKAIRVTITPFWSEFMPSSIRCCGFSQVLELQAQGGKPSYVPVLRGPAKKCQITGVGIM